MNNFCLSYKLLSQNTAAIGKSVNNDVHKEDTRRFASCDEKEIPRFFKRNQDNFHWRHKDDVREDQHHPRYLLPKINKEARRLYAELLLCV